MGKMFWGLVFALFFVGLLDYIPRKKFHQVLGEAKGIKGVLRATAAGILLDLCSHGILLIGMKLYERGAHIGQVVAFLVASPWNSFSMTLILWGLIGLPWTLAFIVGSCVVAIISGLYFQWLVGKGVLPANPKTPDLIPEDKVPWIELPPHDSKKELFFRTLKNSLQESKMILRWIFFGVVLTALVSVFVSPDTLQTFFGPTAVGVVLTLAVATVLEVCSEGSAPLASELVTTARAPGNGFTFLMAGVSTDYTEIMALKETTRTWKIALFLPLITLPQIVIIGIILNWVGA